MTFSGDLAGIGLGDVFQNIAGNRLTGTLVVSAAGGDRHVYFREGLVVGFSLGPNRGLPIAEHLEQRQYVSGEDLAKATRRKVQKKTTLQKVLESMNLLDEADFRAATEELVQERLYDMIAVKHADFVFEEGKPRPRVFDREQKAAKIAIDPNGILMEGARRLDESSRIHQVVTSDQDLFVVVEGWEEFDLTEMQIEVAHLLDGYTEIGAVVKALPYARFEVLKAVHDLVRFDLARPLTSRELESMVQEALADDRTEDAVVLMYRALLIERSNSGLRTQLADLLERLGRQEEAAMELTVLGYEEAQAGRTEEALAFYEKACALKPGDIGIQEKRVELLKSIDGVDYVQVLFVFIQQLLGAGLGEKARTLLEEARPHAKGERLIELDKKLAEIAAQLGDHKTSAKIYLRLAKQLPKTDSDGKLEMMRLAAAHRPKDRVLQRQLADLESGLTQRRHERLRFYLRVAAGVTVALALGTMGVIEMVASHRVISSVQGRLDDLVDGRPGVAFAELNSVRADYEWTIAGYRARNMQKQLFTLQVRRFEKAVADGHAAEVLPGLQSLMEQVEDSGRRGRLASLLGRAKAEVRAAALFDRVNTDPEDAEARADYAELQSTTLLEFHLRQLVRRDGVTPQGYRAVLSVLLAMDNPRSIATVAEYYLTASDQEAARIAEVILTKAPSHRAAGESYWRYLYPTLEAARGGPDPVTAVRAHRLVHWLREGK